MIKSKQSQIELTITKFEEYSKWTGETAIYPKAKEIPGAYPFVKMWGEFKEFTEAVSYGINTNIAKEAGDVLWYCARVFIDLKLAPITVDELNYRIVPELDIPNIHEAIGKLWRDNNEDKRNIVRDGVIGVIGFMICFLDTKDISLIEVMNINIEKLTKRLEKGTIHGDGDDR